MKKPIFTISLILLGSCGVKVGPSAEAPPPTLQVEASLPPSNPTEVPAPANNNSFWQNPTPATGVENAYFVHCKDTKLEIFMAFPKHTFHRNSWGLIAGELGPALVGRRTLDENNIEFSRQDWSGLIVNGPSTEIVVGKNESSQKYSFKTYDFIEGQLTWSHEGEELELSCKYYRSEGYELPSNWEML